MYEEIAKVWVEALRSGGYTQGKYALKTNPDAPTHCCLGVLCEVYQQQNPTSPLECAPSTVSKHLGNGAYEYLDVVSFNHESEVLPLVVQTWSGLQSPEGSIVIDDFRTSLAQKNDKGSSFAELAHLIEDNQHLL
jgi:hypothetical protein